MELPQVCGPLLVAIILQLPMFLYQLQGLVISVDDRLFVANVMLPLVISLDNGIHFVVIGELFVDCI